MMSNIKYTASPINIYILYSLTFKQSNHYKDSPIHYSEFQVFPSQAHPPFSIVYIRMPDTFGIFTRLMLTFSSRGRSTCVKRSHAPSEPPLCKPFEGPLIMIVVATIIKRQSRRSSLLFFFGRNRRAYCIII